MMTEAAKKLALAIDEYMEQVFSERMNGSITEQRMVAEYGEMIGRGEAAKLLGVSPGTVTAMCRDTRLSGTPLGVSVRSIARYIDEGRPSSQKVKRMRAQKNGGMKFRP